MLTWWVNFWLGQSKEKDKTAELMFRLLKVF